MCEVDPGIITKINEGLHASNVTFLVGAGISVDRSSHVPSWRDLVRTILTNIAGVGAEEEVEYVMQYNKLLFNEVIFKLFSEVFGTDLTVDLLSRCFSTTNWSVIHYQLAYLSATYDAPIITPNFDELIEEAHKVSSPEKSLAIIKVHGTVSNLKNARFTVENIFEPLKEEIADRVKGAIQGRLLVVMGYRGADNFDLMPLLANKASQANEIIWFVRDKDNIEVKKSQHLRQRQKQPEFIEGSIDDYLSRICGALPVPPVTSPVSPRWWRDNISDFFSHLPREKKVLLPFLWARILEHVKAYSLHADKEKSAVINAYTSYIKQTPSRDLTYYYARAHLLYAQRIIGTDVSSEFAKLVSDLRAEIIEKPQFGKSLRLQRLLGWTYHQFGVSLQRERKFYQAKLMLSRACVVRSTINDPEYASSLFQLFMNAYMAKSGIDCEIDDFAPMGWRTWMPSELKIYSETFYQLHKPDLYSTSQHNLGFIYYYLGLETGSQSSRTRELLIKALENYNEALNIREHLRDERLIAQSYVRIAQCHVQLMKVTNDAGEWAKSAAESGDAIREADSIYQMIPQEAFRLQDLRRIKKERDQEMNRPTGMNSPDLGGE